MKVFYIAAECKPFAKEGGVADVAGELPPVLKQQGVDIEIVMPLYGMVDLQYWDPEPVSTYEVRFHGKKERVQIHRGELKGVPVNFVKNPTYFEKVRRVYIHSEEIPFYDDALRFSFFSEACLRLIAERQPDIVHINDWLLGYLFGRMAMEGLPSRRVLTIHNIGYQGNMWQGYIRFWHMQKILDHKDVGPLFVDPRLHWVSVNPLRLGMELAHMTNTVSPTYCAEIAEPENPAAYFEGGKGLDGVAKRLRDAGKLIGILNGLEYKFEPTDEEFARILGAKAEAKKALSTDFANPDGLLLGFVGRAVEQKFRLLTEELDGKPVLEHLLDIPGVNVALLATGLPEYEAFMRQLQGRENTSVTVAFDRVKAGQISLGSDIFLMPSLFEPCGITQMESLSNATPPLVRWTGGLVDTVAPHTSPEGTGFGFGGREITQGEAVLRDLVAITREALAFHTSNREAFWALQHRGFQKRFLWSDTADRYIEDLYLPALRSKA